MPLLTADDWGRPGDRNNNASPGVLWPLTQQLGWTSTNEFNSSQDAITHRHGRLTRCLVRSSGTLGNVRECGVYACVSCGMHLAASADCRIDRD